MDIHLFSLPHVPVALPPYPASHPSAILANQAGRDKIEFKDMSEAHPAGCGLFGGGKTGSCETSFASNFIRNAMMMSSPAHLGLS